MNGWRDRLLRQWQQPGPTWVSVAGRPLAWIYAALVALRRARYTRRPDAVQRLPVPVVVVGNWIIGGAGKTPTVIALVRLLRGLGWTPGVISRGHGRRRRDLIVLDAGSTAAEVGDEPLLIQRRTGAAVAVAADRVAAARALLAAHPQVDLLVADDGLQHLRLGRDVEVIVFDDRGAGNSLVLPAGPLREPMPERAPAQAIVLYTAGRQSTRWPGHVGERRLGGVVDLAAWWQGAPADAQGWAALRGRPIAAAAGTARPQTFFAMLRAAGIEPVPCALPDHFDYRELPWPAGTAEVIVTEKDAVKIAPERVVGTKVWVATLDFEPAPSFGAAIEARLGRPPRRGATP